MKDNDLDQLSNLIRNYVHLDRDEIDSYLEGALDPELVESVEEHLDSCAYCSNEVELITESRADENVQELSALLSPRSEKKGLVARVLGRWFSSGAKPSASETNVSVRPEERTGQGKLWIGDKNFDLNSLHEGLFEVQGLVKQELVNAWEQDCHDPGSRPMCIQGAPGLPALILVSVSARPENLKHFQRQELGKMETDRESPTRTYAPSLPETRKGKFKTGTPFPTERFSSLKSVPKPEKTVPHFEIILSGETEHHLIGFFREKVFSKILLKIVEK